MTLLETDAPPFDTMTFRNACGRFLTGVTIVTTRGLDDEPVGMTANAFTSVSLEPPLVLVCVGRTASSFAAMEQADRYAVHVLPGDQEALSTQFARSAVDGLDKFERLDWVEGAGGVPLLEDHLARFVCRIVDRHEAGDHMIYIGEVEDLALGDASAGPLGFYQGAYARIA